MTEFATTAIVDANAGPAILVIGCGGAGINLVSRASNVISERAAVRYYDTSRSNDPTRASEQHDHLPVTIIGPGFGSGGHRPENVEHATKYIATMSDEEFSSFDLIVVAFALGGGSGSVIGPLMIKEIARRGGRAVAFMVADTYSQKRTENTHNTIKSLIAICNDGKIYLPCSIFDNAVGRQIVDTSFVHRLQAFVHIETMPAREVDRNDRLNWLDGKKTLNAQPGLRPMHVSVGENGDDDERSGELWAVDKSHIYDAELNLATDSAELRLGAKARWVKEGFFATAKFTPMVGLVAGNADLYKSLIADVETSVQQFKTQSLKITPVIDVNKDEVDESGLCL